LLLPLRIQKLKSFQFQGGFAFAPWPPDQGLCPWTPVIGSRSRARHDTLASPLIASPSPKRHPPAGPLGLWLRLFGPHVTQNRRLGRFQHDGLDPTTQCLDVANASAVSALRAYRLIATDTPQRRLTLTLTLTLLTIIFHQAYFCSTTQEMHNK